MNAIYDWFHLDRDHLVIQSLMRHPVRYRMQLDLLTGHERMAFYMSGYEPDTTRFLLRLYEKPGYFLDIGANIGLITIPFVTSLIQSSDNFVSSDPIAVCVEPVFSNHAALSSNLHMNGLADRVLIIKEAVGEREKIVDIQVEGNRRSGQGTGTANIIAEASDYQCERIPLKVTTLDALARAERLPRSRCTLIKIDTDGYDLFALLGASTMLQKDRPIIYGEFMAHCMRWHGQSLEDVRRLAAKYDYRCYIKRDRSFRFQENGDEEHYCQDLLLAPSERVSSITWCLN